MSDSDTKDEQQSTFSSFASSFGSDGKVDAVRTKFRKKRSSFFSQLQSAGKSLPIFVFATLVFMFFVAACVFFVFVKGPEEVMVPNVVGRKWSDALIMLQEKELYAKITLHYTNNPNSVDVVLSQKPESSSIVTGYSRVELVIGSKMTGE